MKRNGKALKTLPDGHRRRLSDARNAWRKMTDEQRSEFLSWIEAGASSANVLGSVLDPLTHTQLVTSDGGE